MHFSVSLCLCLSVFSCASGVYFLLFLFFLSFFRCLLTDIFSKCSPALFVNGKNEGNEDGFFICRRHHCLFLFLSVCVCVVVIVFSLSFGVCACC